MEILLASWRGLGSKAEVKGVAREYRRSCSNQVHDKQEKNGCSSEEVTGCREPSYARMGSLTLSAGVHHDSLWSSGLPKSSQSLHARISV